MTGVALPCRFCGGKAEARIDEWGGRYSVAAVACGECGASVSPPAYLSRFGDREAAEGFAEWLWDMTMGSDEI